MVFLFLSTFIGLAVGLFKLSHYLEEHPNSAFTPIKLILGTSYLFHIYLYFINVPLVAISLSLIVHVLFSLYLSNYPLLKAKDRLFIFPTILAFINHFYLVYITNVSNYGIKILVAFFVNWTVPLVVVFCVSANQDTLNITGSVRQKSIKVATALDKIFSNSKTIESKS